MDITTIASITQSLAAIAVAVPAYKGLNTWSKQLIGTRKIGLAEDVLTLAYTLQGAIEWARNPLIFTGEGADRQGRDQEADDKRRRNDSYYASISRLSEHEEEFAKMRSARMKFRAYFGEEGQEALLTFSMVRNKIGNAVGMLIRSDDTEPLTKDFMSKLQSVIWDTTTKEKGPDEISQQINDAIKEVERLCRPILTNS